MIIRCPIPAARTGGFGSDSVGDAEWMILRAQARRRQPVAARAHRGFAVHSVSVGSSVAGSWCGRWMGRGPCAFLRNRGG
jgi:hypothetical protein